MRKTILIATATTLMLAGGASAQQQPAQQPAPAPTAPAPAEPRAQPVPTIQSVNIVDITELPKDTQTQVNQVIAQRGDDGLQKLRNSIDATPKVKSALEAKGLSSAQVVAASMEPNGALTLITKKAS
ncbi:hypothetical protein ACFSQT_14590 [Mesorhizobium calcicola]|uniref:Uncharacterized protein n=1 Tax=Mesorhizobium calcicola TaxID=1300310 RepID=A0ABW4WCB0_9HYPH